MLLPNYPMELIHPLMVYGSVILAFFGAMHWELAIEKLNVEDRNRVSVDLTDGSKEFVELSQAHSAFQGIKIRARTRLRIVD